jgi:ribonuclease VapC
MILDTSAVIAILRNEPEAPGFAKTVERAVRRRISAVNYVEAAAVIDGSGDPIASRRYDDPLREAQVAIEPVTELKRELHVGLMQTSAKPAATRRS